MRLLFVLKSPLTARNFEWVLGELADRGHQVHVAVEHELGDQDRQWELIDRLRAAHPSITAGMAARRRDDRWRELATELRLALDYLRFYHPEYKTAPRLWERAGERAPSTVTRLMRSPLLQAGRGLATVGRLLGAMEEAIPPSPEIEAYLAEQRPDVMIVSPLIRFGTPQADYLQAARRLGIPNVYCAFSWDNLTTKGLIRGDPDLVVVWNEIQRRESIDLHSIPPERVIATGASPYDHWFDWKPSTSREEFCRAVGLPPDRPYVLYLGSALISGDEVPFVERWARFLRHEGGPEPASAGILIRPHPKRPVRPEDFAVAEQEEGVAVWPKPGTSAVDADWRSTLFDSIHHSEAVVGLNTTAFIDAGVIGRPSYTVLPPEFSDSQEDTVHFHYLTELSGGLLNVARTLEDHAAQLSALLRGEVDPEPGRRFIADFVRPGGIDVPATRRLADVLEEAGRRPPRPQAAVSEPGLAVARAALRPFAEAAWWRADDAKRVRVKRKRTRNRVRAWRATAGRLLGLARRRRFTDIGRELGERASRPPSAGSSNGHTPTEAGDPAASREAGGLRSASRRG